MKRTYQVLDLRERLSYTFDNLEDALALFGKLTAAILYHGETLIKMKMS